MAIPKRYRKFMTDFPEVGSAYESMGQAVHAAGPLDAKTRALVKLVTSAAARLEGGVHSHCRKAVAAGCTPEEIRHAIVLTLPTIGLPSMMAALSWVDDVLDPAP